MIDIARIMCAQAVDHWVVSIATVVMIVGAVWLSIITTPLGDRHLYGKWPR